MPRDRQAPDGAIPGLFPPPRWGRRELAAAVFTLAYVVPFAVVCLRGGNREFLLYLGVMLLLVPAVALLHARIGLAAATLWGLSAWGLAHLAGGLVHVGDAWPHDGGDVLYNCWLVPGRLKYDQVVHALGFGLSTWICWQGLAAALRGRGLAPRPTVGLLVLSALAGMGLGAVNEIVEFIAVLTIPDTNVGGYVNTGWDLVANAVGAIVAAVMIAALGGRGRD
jgi:hypothetical protein